MKYQILMLFGLLILCISNAQSHHEIYNQLKAREQKAVGKAYHWTSEVYSKSTKKYPHEYRELVDLKIEPLSEGAVVFRGHYPAPNEEGGHEVLRFHTIYHPEWYGCITYDASETIPYSFTVVRTYKHPFRQPLPFCYGWLASSNLIFIVGSAPHPALFDSIPQVPIKVEETSDQQLILYTRPSIDFKAEIKFDIQKQAISELFTYSGAESIPYDWRNRRVSEEEILREEALGRFKLKPEQHLQVKKWHKVDELWCPAEFLQERFGLFDIYQATWRLQSVRDVKTPRDWRTEIPKGIVVMDYRHCGPVAGTIPEGCQPAIYEWQGDFEDRAPAGATSNRPVPWLSWILLATPILLIILGTLWLLKRWRQAHA